MRHRIISVEAGSCAESLGILPGDILVSLNGHDIADIIDYEYFSAESDISAVIEHDGTETEYVFEKDEYEPLGLGFGEPLMSGIRRCANNCVFCFEDQNPPSSRPSLSSRDDDWRLSLMTGSYITMTNIGDKEIGRIIERKASPLYISVHATDPETRVRLMRNDRAAAIMEQLSRLKAGGISFHTQAVLCPGINDGDILEKSIHDLAALSPAALSLAVVPVGLTCHREGCYPLRLFTREEAREVIAICDRWRRICRESIGDVFVHPADEFYLIAGIEPPEAEEYGEFEQIENGVGMLRLLEEEFSMCYQAEFPKGAKKRKTNKKILIATGKAAGGFLAELLGRYPVPGTEVEVRALENTYFGPTVNVAGLITGHELIDEKNGLAGSDADEIWITECMLREGDRVFLDDLTVEDVEKATGKCLRVIQRGGDALFDALIEASGIYTEDQR